MPQVVRNLPQRPLRADEVTAMRDTVHAHCVSQEADAVYLLCVTNETVRALGYDPRIDRWVQFFKTNGEEFEPTRYNDLVAALQLWVDGQYWHEVRTDKYTINLPERVDIEDEEDSETDSEDADPGEEDGNQVSEDQSDDAAEDDAADRESLFDDPSSEPLPSARSMTRMDVDEDVLFNPTDGSSSKD